MSFSDWLTPRLGWPLLLITLARSATSLDQEILVRAMRMDSSEHKSVELSEEDIAVALDEYEVSCEFPLLLPPPQLIIHHSPLDPWLAHAIRVRLPLATATSCLRTVQAHSL